MNPLADAARFAAPPGTYLLSHSVGLVPLGLRDLAVADYFDVWERDPVETWPHWLRVIEDFRAALAELFGHQADWFCPQANVSSGLTKILQALPQRESRSTVLLSVDAFPSVGFVVGRSDRRVTFLDAGSEVTDPAVWIDAMTDDVDLIVITHAHSNTGQLVPLDSIIDAARQRSIVTIIDVAQSAGIVPIDLAALDPDFVVGSCVKWLCGGPGAGFLWCSPRMIDECRPTDVGWFSHAEPFEFDIHHFLDAPDALRFWGGTPAVLPAAVARRSVELMTSIGVSQMRDHNVTLTSRLIDAIPPTLTRSPTRVDERSGTVVIDAGPSTDHVVQRLEQAQIHVDRRANGLRVSPHVYNTSDDIDRFVECVLRSIAET